MKDWNDVLEKLRTLLNKWFANQCHKPFTNYYLYYRPTTPEKGGDLQISPDSPGKEWQLVDHQRLFKGRTVEGNLFYFVNHSRLRRLPILSLKEQTERKEQ